MRRDETRRLDRKDQNSDLRVRFFMQERTDLYRIGTPTKVTACHGELGLGGVVCGVWCGGTFWMMRNLAPVPGSGPACRSLRGNLNPMQHTTAQEFRMPASPHHHSDCHVQLMTTCPLLPLNRPLQMQDQRHQMSTDPATLQRIHRYETTRNVAKQIQIRGSMQISGDVGHQ